MYQSHDYKKKASAIIKDSGDTGSDEIIDDGSALIEINQRPAPIRN
jgi:hypothetical protein